MILASGLFKLACAPVSGWIRRAVPRAGLLGSLAAIALVIISFLPLLEIVAQPVAGLAALAVILATLTARWRAARRLPGALAAVAGRAAWSTTAMAALGLGPGSGPRRPARRRRCGSSCRCRSVEWSRWFRASWRRGR